MRDFEASPRVVVLGAKCLVALGEGLDTTQEGGSDMEARMPPDRLTRDVTVTLHRVLRQIRFCPRIGTG